ncbi:hypothetical protein TRFO_29873 [Tritrichomonas foetus]|uniref:Uncharacterized protein n=1 Tax=Tritrichomonas foetus TaxID=1144522 RepID=A0A1J4JUU4_9EUKA|nr:hypothetical protein TRFO_29873 [Tritrichomonas foetus]|eukprot:OHT02927.1 hypothetical protein TRFO_29873 [Tritrichomonas foetus]
MNSLDNSGYKDNMNVLNGSKKPILDDVDDILMKIVLLLVSQEQHVSLIKNTISKELNLSLQDPNLDYYTYHYICKLMSFKSLNIQSMITEIIQSIIMKGKNMKQEIDMTRGLFQISPEIYTIYYFSQEFNCNNSKFNQQNFDFIESFYKTIFNLYTTQFLETFCFFKVVFLEILTSAFIWKSNNKRFSFEFFHLHTGYYDYDKYSIQKDQEIILKEISNLIANNKYLFAHKAGVKCLLKILKEKCWIPGLIDFIPLLIDSSYSEETLYLIYQCIGILSGFTLNDEYQIILKEFLYDNVKKRHSFSFNEQIYFFYMVIKFIKNKKMNYFDETQLNKLTKFALYHILETDDQLYLINLVNFLINLISHSYFENHSFKTIIDTIIRFEYLYSDQIKKCIFSNIRCKKQKDYFLSFWDFIKYYQENDQEKMIAILKNPIKDTK